MPCRGAITGAANDGESVAGFWEGVGGSWASPLRPDGERGEDAMGAGDEGRGVEGGKEPEPGNVPGTDVAGTALRTANKLLHSAEAWFVKRRRASEDRRSDQSLGLTTELEARDFGTQKMTLTSRILAKSSGSLATILSRAIFASARHEFDIYRNIG